MVGELRLQRAHEALLAHGHDAGLGVLSDLGPEDGRDVGHRAFVDPLESRLELPHHLGVHRVG